MGRFIDLTGKKFGRLMVIRRSLNNKWNKTAWLCKCECGTEKIILGKSLTSKIEPTKSCGCINAELCRSGIKSRKKFGFASMNYLFLKYRAFAKKHKRKFKLTKEQFFKITQQDCYYCGAKPTNIMKSMKKKIFYGDYIYNGLDRSNNEKGYTMNNVVPCCKHCNMAKNNRTVQKFKEWVKRIYDNMYGVS